MTSSSGRCLGGPVLVDVQATQSASHRDRGVARYTAELAGALWQRDPALVHSFLLNPDLAPPGSVEALVASGRLVHSDRVDVDGARAAARLLADRARGPDQPVVAGARRVARDAVGRDALRPDPRDLRRSVSRRSRSAPALPDPARARARRRPRARDLRDDRARRGRAAARAGGPGRGGRRGGRATSYAPPVSRREALSAARAAVAGLEERFVLYTGGMDDRKNFHGLFRGVGPLPPRGARRLAARDGVQHGRPDAQPPRAPRARCRHRDRLLLPGFVPDAVLRLLYQSTDLFVFPSLYEGYGLPVAEALACGARTIGSGTSSVAELLVPAARFDPASDDAIAGGDRAGAHRRRDACGARRASRACTCPVGTWSPTGSPTRTTRCSSRPRPAGAAPAARRGRDAAPARAASGVADFSYRMIAELRELLRRACVRRRLPARRIPISGRRARPTGVEVLPVRFLVDQERARGGYDCVVYCVGNSEFHGGALAQLRRRSGVVLAHEVRLTDLYALEWRRTGRGARRIRGLPTRDVRRIARRHGRRRAGSLPDESERLGVLMAAEVVALADRFVVMSQFAADRVALDIDPDVRRPHRRRCRSPGRDVVEHADAARPSASRSSRASGS